MIKCLRGRERHDALKRSEKLSMADLVNGRRLIGDRLLSRQLLSSQKGEIPVCPAIDLPHALCSTPEFPGRSACYRPRRQERKMELRTSESCPDHRLPRLPIRDLVIACIVYHAGLKYTTVRKNQLLYLTARKAIGGVELKTEVQYYLVPPSPALRQEARIE